MSAIKIAVRLRPSKRLPKPEEPNYEAKLAASLYVTLRHTNAIFIRFPTGRNNMMKENIICASKWA